MKTSVLFLSLLWRTFVAYLLVALVLAIGFKGLNIDLSSHTLIKLKPTFAYIIYAFILITIQLGAGVNIIQLIAGKKLSLSRSAWRRYAFELSFLFIALAITNAIVAFTAPVESWITYKLFGAIALLVAGIYLIANRISKNAASHL